MPVSARAVQLQERDNEVEVDVTWEDQANINSFGRLNTRLTELREEVKSKKVCGPAAFPPSGKVRGSAPADRSRRASCPSGPSDCPRTSWKRCRMPTTS